MLCLISAFFLLMKDTVYHRQAGFNVSDASDNNFCQFGKSTNLNELLNLETKPYSHKLTFRHSDSHSDYNKRIQ